MSTGSLFANPPPLAPVRALSLRQPWAWLVLHGKDIENRKWPTKLRGEFFIHAAKDMKQREYDDAVEIVRMIRGYDLLLPSFGELERGGIVGQACLVDVIPPCAPPEFAGIACGCGHPWHFGKQYGFKLKAARPLPFQPLRGMLGFFAVPADVLARIGAPT